MARPTGDSQAPGEGLNWFTINDFTPGIRQVLTTPSTTAAFQGDRVLSPTHPPGAAQETDTYGCIAQDGGVLVALPGPTTVTVGSGAPFHANWSSAKGGKGYITGMYANGPVFSLDGGNQTTGGVDQNNTELYIGLFYWLTGRRSQINTLAIYGATGGTYTITVDLMTNGVPNGSPQTTTALAYNASAATVDAALEALSNVGAGDVAVSALTGTIGSGTLGTYNLTWSNGLASQSILVYATWYGTMTGDATRYAAVTVATGADDVVREVWRKTMYRASPTNEQVFTETNDTIYFSTVRPRPCDMGSTRSDSANWDSETGSSRSVGPQVMAFTFDGIARMFPDDQQPAAQTTRKLLWNGTTAVEDNPFVLPAHHVLHQARYVLFPLLLSSNGILTTYVSTEAFCYSLPNDLYRLAADDDLAVGTNYFRLIAHPESPTGFSVIQSLTSDQLLLIKAKGGAVVVNGSLAAPSYSYYPNVKSPGHALNRGCNTPLGFMYPCDGGGLWLWHNGDISENLSPMMQPEFWRPNYSASPFGPGHTSMEQWQEYILLPNNWIYDTDYRGFWRLDQTATHTIHHWVVDWKGRHAYGAPETISTTSTSTVPLVYDYDITGTRNSFSWKSHPLSFSVDREVQVSEVTVIATGDGTVEVTVTSDRPSANTEASLARTFTIDPATGAPADIPRSVAKEFMVQGSHITIKMVSTGDGGSTAAPKIHGIRLGYKTINSLVRT